MRVRPSSSRECARGSRREPATDITWSTARSRTFSTWKSAIVRGATARSTRTTTCRWCRTPRATGATCTGTARLTRLGTERLFHQGVELRPVGLADVFLQHPPVLVDEEAGRRDAYAAELPGDVAVAVERDLEGKGTLLREGGDRVGVVGLHRHRHHLVAARRDLAIGVDHLRHFLDAGRAPGRPEIDQHHLAAQVGRGKVLARERRELHFGGRRPWHKRECDPPGDAERDSGEEYLRFHGTAYSCRLWRRCHDARVSGHGPAGRPDVAGSGL